MTLRLLLGIAVCLTLAAPASARDIYVDNVSGSNLSAGISPDAADFFSGPFRTISKAIAVANAGDVIILRNTGVPYYEPIVLTGVRHNGLATVPFLIQGNGATLSGLMALPREAWIPIEIDLWKIKPAEKGWYQLVRGDAAVAEVRAAPDADRRPTLEPGQWCAWKGEIFYRAQPDEDVLAQQFGLAREDMGISLHRVRNVRIENLTVQHFRIDGINAHDGCRNVELDNVTAKENGRAGLVAAGTSEVIFTNGKLIDNRDYSLLVTERAAAEVNDSELSTPGVVAE